MNAALPVIFTVAALALIAWSSRKGRRRIEATYARHFTPSELEALGRNADGSLKQRKEA